MLDPVNSTAIMDSQKPRTSLTSSTVLRPALALVVLVACLGLMGDAEADELVPLWSDQPSSSQNPTSVAMSDDC
ncbi:MAG: hypothetical protein MK215_05805, partial [Candidatus Poseidoniia archaeon]|nr:hypothetical protein [Candidatus Poseidoniia archaeon]